MELILIYLGIEIYWGLLTYKFYEAAGRKAWEAFVPIYRIFVMIKIAKKPWWWFILMLIPAVGTIMTIVIIYEFLHVFGFRKTSNTAIAVLTLGLYIGYLGQTEKLNYLGRDDDYIKANLGELVNAIFFALVAATIIRATTFEAFTIPTGSMEKSMMIGDFLFVSKLHYGVRMPMTPISFPLVHNKLPGVDAKSYVNLIELPYIRLPKFQEVKKNDIVVFNYPEETWHPIDKREHYVKRCVATPGDTLKIVDRQIYIDGEPQTLPDRSLGMFSYYVKTAGKPLNKEVLKEDFDITFIRPSDNSSASTDVYLLNNRDLNNFEYIVFIPTKKLEEFKALPQVKEVIAVNAGNTLESYNNPELPSRLQTYLKNYCSYERRLFPNPQSPHASVVFKYTADNYGPLYVPKEGETIELNELNFYRYEKAINVHEGHELLMKNGEFILDGEKASSYTFEQDYYWMMGDNRHNSLDSRYWGFVPSTHIVGKPVFIWMSIDWNDFSIRKDRVFTTVSGEGERKSYFFPVLIVALLGWGANKYIKKKRKEKNAA
ncbi:MAG: signal peptidase I [Schleiferiaceae bacterium]|jgi:signal peptidase I|nr:signal peptidase I [Schleiferiaceae bacterium]